MKASLFPIVLAKLMDWYERQSPRDRQFVLTRFNTMLDEFSNMGLFGKDAEKDPRH